MVGRAKALEALIESGDFDYGRTNDETTLNAVMMVGKTQRIANARPEFLYFQRAEVTDESWFYARIHFPDSRPAMNMTFTPGQITASAEFKKRLASAQGAWWSGEAKHLDWIGTRWLQGLKTVETIEYIGYSREHDCYIFPRIAVQGGKTYDINEEDFSICRRNPSSRCHASGRCTSKRPRAIIARTGRSWCGALLAPTA